MKKIHFETWKQINNVFVKGFRFFCISHSVFLRLQHNGNIIIYKHAVFIFWYNITS